MAYHYTLRLSGIRGESVIAEHEGEIDIDQIIQDYEAPGELDKITLLDRSDIRPAVTCEGLTVVTKYEESTPNLLAFLTEGKQIDAAVVSCYGADNQVFLTIDLKQLIVRKAKVRLDQSRAGAEINFSYAEISHTYTPEGAKKALFNYRKEIAFA
jgi:type VI protein secretion system component Hcp